MNSVTAYLLCSVLVLTQSALADNALTRQNTVAVPTSTTMPANVNATLNGSTGIQQNGETASKNQDAGMMAALASAAISAAMAAATCPDPNQQAMCIASTMGALAGLAVAGMMNNAKNKSNAQVATSTVGAPTPSTTESTIDSNRTYAETKKKLAQVSKLAGNQVDVDKGTAKLKDGRELKLSDMKSQATMSAAGLKPSEMKAFADLMKESAKKANIAKGADGNPAPAEMGGGSITQTASSDSPSVGGVAKRVPASVPGATRDFNGTPIGVSVESIWVMMNRRYAHEVENKKFSN